MKLLLPVRDVYVNQPFGVNFVDFYKKLGMDAHNGIDFKTRRGCKVLATHTGIVTFAGKDKDGGISVTLLTNKEGKGYKTIYYHLLKTLVKAGDKVKAGNIIGEADSTGKYTTGDHLHFGLKETMHGNTINIDNGYRGAIDPAPYFQKNWDKSRAYHRYERKGNYIAELKVRFKNPWLHRYLIRRGMLHKVYDNEFINALVYGGWDIETVLNPSMYWIWGWAKKSEFLKGKINFK